jgi:hypothetical protein
MVETPPVRPNEKPRRSRALMVRMKKGPETICDLGAGVPRGTFTVFPGCAGLPLGFAKTLLDESTFSETREGF